MDCRREYRQRQIINERSRSWAHRDGLEWTDQEDDFLIEFWIHVEPRDRDEITVSQCLERTVEACRVRCEHIRARLGILPPEHQTAAVYIGAQDEPDDRWWSSDYYK